MFRNRGYMVAMLQFPDDVINRGFVFSIALKNIMLYRIAVKASYHTNNNLFPFSPIVPAVAIFSDPTIVSVKKG